MYKFKNRLIENILIRLNSFWDIKGYLYKLYILIFSTVVLDKGAEIACAN